MKIGLAFAPMIIFASQAAAHDFWLQPLRFQTASNTDFPITLQIGHAEARQRWNVGLDHIIQLRDVGPAGIVDIRNDFRTAGSADIVTHFKDTGLHVLVLQTSYARSELPAIRFNDYAKSEGLTQVLANRERSGTSGKPGRERYSRRAKALVEVGDQAPLNTRMATRALGLKLEIVPDLNPYALGKNRMLPIHVMYEGRRLSGATVMLTSLEFDAKPVAVAVTNARGEAAFRVPPVGEWLLNVLWSEPVKGDPTADYDTTFSSLTFGYNPAKHAS